MLKLCSRIYKHKAGISFTTCVSNIEKTAYIPAFNLCTKLRIMDTFPSIKLKNNEVLIYLYLDPFLNTAVIFCTQVYNVVQKEVMGTYLSNFYLW